MSGPHTLAHLERHHGVTTPCLVNTDADFLADQLGALSSLNEVIIDSLKTMVDKKVFLRTKFTVTGRDEEGRIAEFVAEDNFNVNYTTPQ